MSLHPTLRHEIPDEIASTTQKLGIVMDVRVVALVEKKKKGRPLLKSTFWSRMTSREPIGRDYQRVTDWID